MSAVRSPTRRDRERLVDAGACAVALLFAARVWIPIIRNYFFGDDFLHLYSMLEHGFWRFTLSPFGGHLLLVRNAIFYATFAAFGPQSEPFFWCALLTHLVNVVLVFAVIRIATDSALLACFGAVTWGTSPVLEGALGWYSVYGQVVGTTLVLIPLLQALRLRRDGLPLSTGRATVWAALLFGGANCFGTALAFALAFPAVLPLLLPRVLRPWPSVFPLLAFVGLVVVEYLAATWAAGRAQGASMGGFYALGLLLSYWVPQVKMLFHLLAYAPAALTLGDLLPAQWYPGRLSSAVLLMWVGGIGAALWRGDRTRRETILALLALTAACSVAIAIGRGGYFSAFFADLAQTAVEPRYHYLSLIPLTVVGCLVLSFTDDLLADVPYPRRTLLVAWLAFIAVGWTARRTIDHHERDRGDTIRALVQIRLAAQAGAGGTADAPLELDPDRREGLTIVPNTNFRPTRLTGWGFPGIAGVFLVFATPAERAADDIRFAAPADAIASARAEGRRRLERLLVPIEPLVDRWRNDSLARLCPLERLDRTELPDALRDLAGPGGGDVGDFARPDPS